MMLLSAPLPASAKPRHAGATVTETYEIEGKRASKTEFEARLSTLKGHAEYHCKKTTFGGVTWFKAQDAKGRWFRVTQVSGSDRPSSIEPTEAPEDPGEE